MNTKINKLRWGAVINRLLKKTESKTLSVTKKIPGVISISLKYKSFKVKSTGHSFHGDLRPSGQSAFDDLRVTNWMFWETGARLSPALSRVGSEYACSWRAWVLDCDTFFGRSPLLYAPALRCALEAHQTLAWPRPRLTPARNWSGCVSRHRRPLQRPRCGVFPFPKHTRPQHGRWPRETLVRTGPDVSHSVALHNSDANSVSLITTPFWTLVTLLLFHRTGQCPGWPGPAFISHTLVDPAKTENRALPSL